MLCFKGLLVPVDGTAEASCLSAAVNLTIFSETAADFTGNIGNGKGGETSSSGGIKAIYRLNQADLSPLDEIFQVSLSILKAQRDHTDEPRVCGNLLFPR